MGIPIEIASAFWDYDKRCLSWPRDESLIIGRLLMRGNWEQLRWLRENAGKALIRKHLRRSKGKSLSPRQIRYWALMLDLSDSEANEWIARQAKSVWACRNRETK